MKSTITLNKLPINTYGRIHSLHCVGSIRRRILDLGMINGTKIPKPVVERPWIDAWIGRALRIWPKAPPAPVMARIAALSVIPADTQERVFFFSDTGIIPIARNTPMRRATTGLPRKVKILAMAPVAPTIETTEAIPMRMIGSRIGAKLWKRLQQKYI